MCKHLKVIKNLANYIVYVQVDGENCSDKGNGPCLTQSGEQIKDKSIECAIPQAYIMCDESGMPMSVYVYDKIDNLNNHTWKKLPDSEVKNNLENM